MQLSVAISLVLQRNYKNKNVNMHISAIVNHHQAKKSFSCSVVMVQDAASLAQVLQRLTVYSSFESICIRHGSLHLCGSETQTSPHTLAS